MFKFGCDLHKSYLLFVYICIYIYVHTYIYLNRRGDRRHRPSVKLLSNLNCRSLLIDTLVVAHSLRLRQE